MTKACNVVRAFVKERPCIRRTRNKTWHTDNSGTDVKGTDKDGNVCLKESVYMTEGNVTCL